LGIFSPLLSAVAGAARSGRRTTPETDSAALRWCYGLFPIGNGQAPGIAIGRDAAEAGPGIARDADFDAIVRFLAAGFFLTVFFLAGFRAGFFLLAFLLALFPTALRTAFFFLPDFFFVAFFFALAMKTSITVQLLCAYTFRHIRVSWRPHASVAPTALLTILSR